MNKVKLLLLITAFLLPILTAAQHTKKTETDSHSKWQWSDDDWKRRVEVRGKAEFNDDYSDVVNVSENGWLRLEEEHNSQTYRFEVTRGTNGQLVRKYFVNGEARELDENGRKWIAGLLLMAVRQGAIDVDKRVQTLLRQRGVNGTLDEISNIKSDHAKRIYFESLLGNHIGSSDLPKVIAAIRAQISSDYEKANILKKSADVFLINAAPRDAYFQAIIGITSDYERRGVLSVVAKRKNLTAPVLAKLLEAAATFTSDYEKANFLLEASSLYSSDANLRSAFLKTVETIKSDHERGRVLSEMLRRKQIG